MTTLEKIKADIKNQLFVGRILNSKDFDEGLKWCIELIDKYTEQEPCDVVEPTKIKAMQELINESYYKGFIDGKEEGLREAEQEPTNTKLMLMEANINGYTEGLKDSSKVEQEPRESEDDECI